MRPARDHLVEDLVAQKVVGLGKGQQHAHCYRTLATAESPHREGQRFIAGENQYMTLIIAQHGKAPVCPAAGTTQRGPHLPVQGPLRIRLGIPVLLRDYLHPEA